MCKNKIKNYFFVVYILFLESFITAIVLSPFLHIGQNNYIYSVIIGIGIFTIAFTWWKLLLESWLFFLIAFILCKNKHTQLTPKVFKKSRKIMVSIIFVITLVALFFERDSIIAAVIGSVVFPLIYAVHFTIPYKIFKRHLNNIYNKHLGIYQNT